MNSNYYSKSETTTFVNSNGKVKSNRVLMEDDGFKKKTARINQRGKNIDIEDELMENGVLIEKKKNKLKLNDPNEAFEYFFSTNPTKNSIKPRIPLMLKPNTSDINQKPDYKMRPYSSQIDK